MEPILRIPTIKWEKPLKHVRNRKGPVLLHANCPLLGHHTSGVRKEWYRSADDLELHTVRVIQSQNSITIY